MERNALLAIVISLIILLVYYELVLPRYYPTVPEGPPREIAEEPRPPAPSERAAPPAPAPREVPPVAIVPAGEEVVIETDHYRAVFTTAGGRLESFRLKSYRTAVDGKSPPLELIHQAPPGDLPLGVILRGPEKQVADAGVAYRADREGLQLSGSESGAVTLTGELEGATVTKRIEVQGDQYFLNAQIRADGVPDDYTELAIGWNKQLPEAQAKGQEVLFNSVVALQAGKLHYENFGDIEKGIVLSESIDWVAYSGQYFLAAMDPNAGNGEPQDDLKVWVRQQQSAIETQLLMPPGRFETRFDVYLGPKSIEILEGHSLRRAVDLGWFSFVALPLLQVLKFSHRLTGNYGIDIILLTVLIKILFIPLTQKSFQSMKQMQKLQPEMARLRERLKDKPEEMNREVMELYRRHKVNPLGGCLPMLLQMPVFIGLYQALLNAVELRHAHFAGWINDLSAPDRLGDLKIPFVDPAGFPVLTILMGASMFVQQWMTPTTSPDPTQQRIMMIMPLLFTFMFINFPSGLTLYWLVNNILTIAQQYAINRPDKK